jgi:hypothetical protein
MPRLFSWRKAVLASFAIFSLSLLAGMNFWMEQSEQWRQYMLGRMVYTTAAYDQAVDYFDVSYSNYQQLLAANSGAFTAPPSLEIAELSQHFKALALAKEGTEGSVKMAVLAFKEALKLTTEDALKDAGLSQSEVRKIRKDRSFTQQDLEILFHSQPKQVESQGKGRDKGSPSDKKGDDPTKSNPPGQESRDQL